MGLRIVDLAVIRIEKLGCEHFYFNPGHVKTWLCSSRFVLRILSVICVFCREYKCKGTFL